MKASWMIKGGIAGIVGTAMSDAWLVPWLQAMKFEAAGEGAQSLALRAVQIVTYPVEVSVLTIVIAVVIALTAWAVLRRINPRGPAQFSTTIKDEDIKRLIEVADAADHRTVVDRNDKVVSVYGVPQDGLTQDERRLMRVLALTNLEPVPLKLAKTVFSGDNVAMLATLNSLQGKSLIAVDQAYVVLSLQGVHWANEELKRGLGKYIAPVRPEEPEPEPAHPLDLSNEELKILRLLAKSTQQVEDDTLLMQAKMTAVRFGHSLDTLIEGKLIEVSRTVRNRRFFALTRKGRAYVVEHNLDRDPSFFTN